MPFGGQSMKNKNKGCFLNIYKDPTGKKKDYIIEMGGEYDSFRIAVDFANLLTIKNNIIKIEEGVKKNERDFDS